MTKSHVYTVLIVLLVACLAAQGYDTYRLEGIATQGAQAHEAVCRYKADLDGRVQMTTAFLKLTPAEIRQRYGPAFVGIPRKTLEQSLRAEKSAAAALAPLVCPATHAGR